MLVTCARTERPHGALPQTGETKQNSSILGVIALGLAGMLGLGFKKEEKENK